MKLPRFLGVGHRGENYRYGVDDLVGPVSESRLPRRWVKTTCGYCSVGCGMLAGERDGQIVAVRGDPDHPVNRGRLCPKGLSEHHTLTAPGRLTTPLLKDAKGRQQPASWDTALDTVAHEVRRLLDEHGPESVAILSTGQLVTEEFYTLGKLARLGLGLAHFDGNTTLCMASAVAGYKLSFGSDGPPGSYDDLALADVVVLIGANVADNHPLLAPRLLANETAHVIAIDPRVTKTAMVADQHLALRPRSDVVLLNGIIKILIDEDLVDHDYIAAHTSGYAELAAHVQAYPLDRVAAECGLAADAVRDVARRIGRAERAFVAWTMGVNHSVQGSETVALINTLCLITGNVGRAGSAPFSITGQCNAMGTREAGFTASMPGYRPYDDPAARAELAALLGVAEGRLPAERGRAYPDIVNAVVDGRIKGLWIIATNPTVSFPNRELLEDALARLDLLVVQDGYATPTTALADVVLPAAVWGEKDGTYTNSERRVSRVRKVVDPPGEARSDFAIFLDLAERLGAGGDGAAGAGSMSVREELYAGWTGPEDAFAEWARVSAGRPCDCSDLTWDAIEAAGGIQWGGERLYADGVFPTRDGRARLQVVDPVAMSDKPRRRFPLLLNTGRTVEHWHTRTKTGRVEILERLAPEAWVELNPGDARSHNVRSGDVVRLVSERGAIDRIVVRVTSVVREGEVFVPFHYDEACANRLTINEFDPISREPNYKQCAVRLERVRKG